MTRPAPPLQRLLELPPADRRIGPFVLVEQLGRGGFAPVWLAREVYGESELRTAAVKLFALDASPDARARVIAEARALCRVEHPHVVRFYALPIDEELGIMGLAMEHLDGTSLHARLAAHGRLEVAQTIDVGVAIATALGALHRVNLLHRDVKPANVVEAAGVYKLIDFGIASAHEPGAPAPRRPSDPGPSRLGDLPLSAVGTRASALAETARFELPCGTVGYIDPVILAEGEPATTASDLYALGATLFECLTGRVPAASGAGEAGSARTLRGEVLDGRAPAPRTRALAPATPAALARIVDALLAPTRRDRPASADEVARALVRLRGASPPRRRAMVLVAVPVLVAAVAGGVAYRRASDTQGEPVPQALTAATPAHAQRAPAPRAPAAATKALVAPAPSSSARAAPVKASAIPVLALTVAEGRLPGGAWLPSFTVRHEPGDEGLRWLDAAERCSDRGLALCTETQWSRACEEDARVGAIETWTISAEADRGFVVRGGAGCDAGRVAGGADPSPARAGICCSRVVAIQSSNRNRAFIATTSDKLLGFEAASRQGGAALGATLADSLQFFTEGVTTRAEAVAAADALLARSPDFWVVFDTCSIAVDVAADTWTADCQREVRQDGKIASELARLVWSGGAGRILSARTQRTLRALSAP